MNGQKSIKTNSVQCLNRSKAWLRIWTHAEEAQQIKHSVPNCSFTVLINYSWIINIILLTSFNSETANLIFHKLFDQLEQVDTCLVFFLSGSCLSKPTCWTKIRDNFRIHSLGIGCWICWARYCSTFFEKYFVDSLCPN